MATNKRFGFADAVRRAVDAGSDNWEIHLYSNNNWDRPSGNVYMETRTVALGPEWSEFRSCVFAIEDPVFPRKAQVRLAAGLSSVEAPAE